jgi:hypothetical protein
MNHRLMADKFFSQGSLTKKRVTFSPEQTLKTLTSQEKILLSKRLTLRGTLFQTVIMGILLK